MVSLEGLTGNGVEEAQVHVEFPTAVEMNRDEVEEEQEDAAEAVTHDAVPPAGHSRILESHTSHVEDSSAH